MPPRHIVQGTDVNVNLSYTDEPSPGILKPSGDKGKMQ